MNSDSQPKPAAIPGARVIGHLGSGGFADVFLYQQETMHRRVAIKIQRSGTSTELDKSFRAEVDLLARVSSHPAIVSVHDAGTTLDGRQYMVMEYCPPPSLSGHIKMREFTPADVVDMGIRLAGALASLHALGIVHRDVKPANILLTEFGHPVLTDFGLATALNTVGIAAGRGFSVPWAPPEQHNANAPVGVPGDLYSLAGTLYTMLARRAPFEIPGGDNTELAMIARVLKAPLPPIGRSDIPPRLERVLGHAMAKDPADRYQTAIAFARELQRVQHDMNERTTPIDVFSDTYSAKHMNEQRGEETRQAIALLLAQAHTPEDNTVVARVVDRAQRPNPGTGAGVGTAAGTPAASGIDRTAGGDTTPVRGPASTGAAGRETNAENNAGVTDAPPHDGQPRQAESSFVRRAAPIMWAVLAGLMATIAFLAWNNAHSPREHAPANDNQVTDLAPMSQQPQVRGLHGQRVADGVQFSWESASPDATYLYRVVDPLDTHEVLRTRDTSVTVPVEPGRTCLEVVVRYKNGTSSATASTCVDTP